MNKLWVGLLFVLLLGLLLTVALTVTFLYKDKKDKKEEKEKKTALWSFHVRVDDEHELKGTLEKVLNVDIYKTEEYTVEGFKLTPKKVSHTFDNLTLTGWVHDFENPVKLVKVTVGPTTLPLSGVTLTSSFALFHRESADDFVTLWHDDSFQHYSTKGHHICSGSFPFSDGDSTKNPEVFGLPKGTVLDRRSPSELEPEESLPKPSSEPTPSTPAPAAPSTPAPVEPSPSTPGSVEPKTPVPVEPESPSPVKPSLPEGPLPLPEDPLLKEPSPELVVDLDLSVLVPTVSPFCYTTNFVEVTVTKDQFHDYYKKLTYKCKGGQLFDPVLKYEGKFFKLKDSHSLRELTLYSGPNYLEPYFVTFRHSAGVSTWYHKGKNEWEVYRHPTVDLRDLDNFLCLRLDKVAVDLSQRESTYTSGNYKVVVKENRREYPSNNLKHFEGFRSFTHTFYDSRTASPATPVAFRFRVSDHVLHGVTDKANLTSVTAYYWEKNLKDPLLITVQVKNAFLDYLGLRYYGLVGDSDKLPARLAEINYRENHALVVDLYKTKRYTFDGSFASQVSKFVTTYDYTRVASTPHRTLNDFIKVEHSLQLVDEQRVLFHVMGFKGLRSDLPDEPSKHYDVSSVSVYFHKSFTDVPLLVSVVGVHQKKLYSVKFGNVNQTSDDFDKLDELLLYSAFLNLNYVLLDPLKFASYQYNGEYTSENRLLSPVKVTFTKDTPGVCLSRFTHEFQHEYYTGHFRASVKGLNLKLPTILKSMEVYFYEKNLKTPLALVFNGYLTKKFYLLENGKFEDKLYTPLDQLEVRLRAALYHVKPDHTLFVDMRAQKDYYWDIYNQGVKVAVHRDEKTNVQVVNWHHRFPCTSDVKLFCNDMVVDTLTYKFPKKLCQAKVALYQGRCPLYVMLTDEDNKVHTLKYDGDKKWSSTDSYNDIAELLKDAPGAGRSKLDSDSWCKEQKH